MKRMGLLLLGLISLISMIGCQAPVEEVNANERYISVQLLGMNDFHGQLDVYRTVKGKKVGGAEYLASYLKKYEEENANTLLLHVGDAVGGSSPSSSLYQDEPTIEFLNRLGFDVATVGNHEFDEGYEELKRLVFGGEHERTGYFAGSDFPYTVANVIDQKTGKPILPPYVIKVVEGIPIGFIGVVTTETTNFVLPDGIKDLQFTDEVAAINKAAEELQEKGVEAIIVLAHNSVSSKKDGSAPAGDAAEFAHQVDDAVDIIYGAHNHVYANTIVDNKLLVQSYSSGIAFSHVDVMIDPVTKDIVEKEADIVITYHHGVKPDKEIEEMIKLYQRPIGPLINEVIGRTEKEITRKQNASGESELGSLVADSQRAFMATDFAFISPGSIRAGFDKGDITWGEVYIAFPFEQNLITMEMTGAQIKAVLEQQWTGESSRMLQISGLHYSWDEGAPIGERVIELKEENGGGAPLMDDKIYTVTVNELLASGGDGFTVFTEGTNWKEGPMDIEVMAQYIQSNEGVVEAPPSDRIHSKK